MIDFVQALAFGYCAFLFLFCTIRTNQLEREIWYGQFLGEHAHWKWARTVLGRHSASS